MLENSSNINWYKKAISIPKSSRGGDCYRAAGKYVMDSGLFGGNQNLILVHGIVTGQGPIRGIQYGHAWVEDGDTVIDVSSGRDLRMPKPIYYALGNIDETQTVRYTSEEMRRKILDSKHWGPWDLQSQY